VVGVSACNFLLPVPNHTVARRRYAASLRRSGVRLSVRASMQQSIWVARSFTIRTMGTTLCAIFVFGSGRGATVLNCDMQRPKRSCVPILAFLYLINNARSNVSASIIWKGEGVCYSETAHLNVVITRILVDDDVFLPPVQQGLLVQSMQPYMVLRTGECSGISRIVWIANVDSLQASGKNRRDDTTTRTPCSTQPNHRDSRKQVLDACCSPLDYTVCRPSFDQD